MKIQNLQTKTGLFLLMFFINFILFAQANPNFYLAPNGITCMCPDAEFGETGTLIIDGVEKTFTKRTRAELNVIMEGNENDTEITLTCTSGITDMGSLFSNMAFFNASIKYWDVSNVTNMSGMFNNAISFNQPLNNWDVSNVKSMSSMFSNATSFNQALDSWSFSSIEFLIDFLSNSNMSVSNYDALLQLFLSQDITNVRLGAQLIGYCDEITRNQLIQNKDWIIDGDLKADCDSPIFFANSPFVSTWEVSNDDLEISIITTNNIYSYNYTIDWGDGIIESGLTGNSSHTYQNSGIYTVSITGTFPHFMLCNSLNNFNCDNAKKIKSVESWGNQLWKSMFSTFRQTEDLVFSTNDTPDLSYVTSMESTFDNAKGFNSTLNDWEVSNVQNMRALFFITDDFNQPLNNWNVSNVYNFQGVFSGANSFNQSLIDWDVSNAKTMTAMFAGPTSFNQPLNNWDVSEVVSMQSMFFNNEVFNQPLNNWNVSKVTNMRWLFNGASSFDQSLSSWNVSNVLDFVGMFNNALSFNQPLNDWDISSAELTAGMFINSVSFNQPLSDWDVSNIQNMNVMFSGAINFNQDLSNWSFNSDVVLTDFLSNSGLDVTNYDLLLESFNTQNLQNKILGADSLEYCDESSRNDLINNNGWSINGDTLSDDCLTCEAPTNLNVSQINVSSAQISFDSSQNGSANILVMFQGQVPGTDTPFLDYQINGFVEGNNSFIQLNLESNTNYDIYIRLNCSITDFSEYSGPLSFQTLCETIDPPIGEIAQSFCDEPTIDDLQIIGENLTFYVDSDLSEVIQSSSNLINNQQIFVTQTINDCESNTLQIVVLVGDNVAPIPNLAQLATVTQACQVAFEDLSIPTANDNCDGEIFGSTSETFPITESITLQWVFEDSNGNISTQQQNIVIDNSNLEIIMLESVYELELNEEGVVSVDSISLSYETNVFCNSIVVEFNMNSFECSMIGENNVIVSFFANDMFVENQNIQIFITDPNDFCENLLIEENRFQDLSIFPNPARTTLNIEGLYLNTIVSIEILDLNGKKIMSKNINYATDLSFNVSNLKDGLYFVKIIGENTHKIQKIIVKK